MARPLRIVAIDVPHRHLISILLDEDASKARKSGLIGIEVESTGMLFVPNIRLKKLAT